MFLIDRTSRKNITGVNLDLARVFTTMAAKAPFDWNVRVTCGLRTPEEQKLLVRLGKSRTLKSKHLPQPDGTGHAIDLVGIEAGVADWTLPRFFLIADAMRAAAQEERVRVTWGAIWKQPLNDIRGSLEAALRAYQKEFQAAHGKMPFLDSPHFQL